MNLFVRGQAAMEFLALVGAVAGLLAVFSLVSFDRQLVLQRERVATDGWAACKQVALEINSAAAIGDGYQHSFTLPAQLDFSRNYSVTVSGVERVVRVDWGFGSCRLPLIPSSFVGGPSQGENTITNQGGSIVFS